MDTDRQGRRALPDAELKRQGGTRPVGSYPPNALSLYDMKGNVWEWVSDWYSQDTYRQSEWRNSVGPPDGNLRVVRGGSWVTHDESQLRCEHRYILPDDTYVYSVGFGVAFSDDRDV